MAQMRWPNPDLSANSYDTSQQSDEGAADVRISFPEHNSNFDQEGRCLTESTSLWDFFETHLSDFSSNLQMPYSSSTPNLGFINDISSSAHDHFVDQLKVPSVPRDTHWRTDSDDQFCPINESHWGAYETPVDEDLSCYPASTTTVSNPFETQGDHLMGFWPASLYPYTSGFTEQTCCQDNLPLSPTSQSHSTSSHLSETFLTTYNSLHADPSSSLSELDKDKSFGGDATSRNKALVQLPNSMASICDIDPPDSDMNTSELGLIPQKQDLKYPENLYVPRWIRGNGRNREAWCGCGRWLSLKRSTYWYHKNFVHGVTISGRLFPEPAKFRQRRESTAREGLCKTCERWIPLGGSKGSETSWYRHIYKCDSMAAFKGSSS